MNINEHLKQKEEIGRKIKLVYVQNNLCQLRTMIYLKKVSEYDQEIPQS